MKQINGRRAVYAMAAAELELRKQENEDDGLESLLAGEIIAYHNLCRIGRDPQRIHNSAEALDWAMCFVLRYPHGRNLVSMARQPLGCSDSEAKRRLYIHKKQQERLEAERAEDDDFDPEEEAAWLAREEEYAKSWKAKHDEERKQAAIAEYEKQEAEKALIRNALANPDFSGACPEDVWEVLRRISTEQGYPPKERV